jgi:hypothetical protein
MRQSTRQLRLSKRKWTLVDANWKTRAILKPTLGMRRGPRIAVAPGAIVISAVVGEKGRGADGDLIAWRSVDGGRS